MMPLGNESVYYIKLKKFCAFSKKNIFSQCSSCGLWFIIEQKQFYYFLTLRENDPKKCKTLKRTMFVNGWCIFCAMKKAQKAFGGKHVNFE